jgi:hypothetical protein
MAEIGLEIGFSAAAYKGRKERELDSGSFLDQNGASFSR